MYAPAVDERFHKLRQITALKLHGQPHPPGNANSVFLLEKTGRRYYLMPAPFFPNNINISVPELFDGYYLYVILADHPQQVMIGPDVTNEQFSEEQTIGGHSSISMGGDVLYAGVLDFLHRELIMWNNASGHYLPSAASRFTQLTPNVKRLLPEALFCDGSSWLP
ncbi:hypothetical protein [Endozoicomonas euniceicola]|uniref:Uncharacterized protein n=1 Tax=Endozoicomonas euniceicola TaxID=1234143 RepID=A0ABY6GQJ2_9GAMM|nr:hypothetical protein [Endozoicomonas euniceicola]UYM14426.1 hypothetical protein NX720_16180 [Endozoicomonas euniceicola]